LNLSRRWQRWGMNVPARLACPDLPGSCRHLGLRSRLRRHPRHRIGDRRRHSRDTRPANTPARDRRAGEQADLSRRWGAVAPALGVRLGDLLKQAGVGLGVAARPFPFRNFPKRARWRFGLTFH
jgi:hypothetical protein